ncbi:hypothetical protein CDD83_155 [Cordyceps sp. RAO-2017]|nr:hypothetical protein CDD83_155 [Cordyceps sp. RAO-2017]
MARNPTLRRRSEPAAESYSSRLGSASAHPERGCKGEKHLIHLIRKAALDLLFSELQSQTRQYPALVSDTRWDRNTKRITTTTAEDDEDGPSTSQDGGGMETRSRVTTTVPEDALGPQQYAWPLTRQVSAVAARQTRTAMLGSRISCASHGYPERARKAKGRSGVGSPERTNAGDAEAGETILTPIPTASCWLSSPAELSNRCRRLWLGRTSDRCPPSAAVHFKLEPRSVPPRRRGRRWGLPSGEETNIGAEERGKKETSSRRRQGKGAALSRPRGSPVRLARPGLPTLAADPCTHLKIYRSSRPLEPLPVRDRRGGVLVDTGSEPVQVDPA